MNNPRVEPVLFRSLEVWVTAVLLDEIERSGELGIEADQLINANLIRRPELAALTEHQRGRMCWRQIDRLVRRRLIESFHCGRHGCNRSRVRFREVNVLDRLVTALESVEQEGHS